MSSAPGREENKGANLDYIASAIQELESEEAHQNNTQNESDKPNKISFRIQTKKSTNLIKATLALDDEVQQEEELCERLAREAAERQQGKAPPLVIRLANDVVKNQDDEAAIAALIHDAEGNAPDRVISSQMSDAQKQIPLLLRARQKLGKDSEKALDEKGEFHQDLSHRPDELDPQSDAYRAVPVEEFGAALLRGMGWKGSKNDEKSKDDQLHQPRHHRLGLGATPAPPKDGFLTKNRPGQAATVKQEQERAIQEEWQKKLELKKIEDDIADKQIKKQGVETKVIDRSLQDKKARKRSRDKLSKDHWLIPNIRVRIISRKVEGKYYKQKALVLDTVKPGVGTLTVEGHIIEQVKEKYLETALPKIGGVVVILAGKQKYQRGLLLSRDTRQGKIQLLDDHTVLHVSLDNIAEWCGNMDFDE